MERRRHVEVPRNELETAADSREQVEAVFVQSCFVSKGGADNGHVQVPGETQRDENGNQCANRTNRTFERLERPECSDEKHEAQCAECPPYRGQFDRQRRVFFPEVASIAKELAVKSVRFLFPLGNVIV